MPTLSEALQVGQCPTVLVAVGGTLRCDSCLRGRTSIARLLGVLRYRKHGIDHLDHVLHPLGGRHREEFMDPRDVDATFVFERCLLRHAVRVTGGLLGARTFGSATAVYPVERWDEGSADYSFGRTCGDRGRGGSRA